MPDKLSGILGICRKAGRLSMGFDMVCEAMRRGNASLVLTATDCSERTLRGIESCAAETNTETRALPLNIDEIGFAVAKRAGVLAVCDSGFAKRIKELLDGTHTA